MSDMGPTSISNKVGPRRRVVMPFTGHPYDLFADGGLVAIEDAVTGEYITVTITDAVARFKQAGILSERADKYATDDTYYREMRDEWRPLVAALEEVIREARAMGDPCVDVVAERKEAAERRSELAAYRQHLFVNPMTPDPQIIDPVAESGGRAYRDRDGVLRLRHGAGAVTPRRYF